MKELFILILAIFLGALQGWYVAFYLSSFLELKIKKVSFYTLCILLILFTKISINSQNLRFNLTYIFFIVVAGLVIFCFYGPAPKKMYHYLYVIFLFLFQNSLLVATQSDPSNIVFLQFIFSYISISVLSLIIIFFLHYFKSTNEIGLATKEYIMLSITPLLSIGTLMYPFHFSQFESIWVSIGLLIVNIMNIFLYNYLTEKTYLLQQQTLSGMQNQYYDEMLRKQSEFRILKHDLKNLLLSINFQLAQGNVDIAQKLLENITLTAMSSFQTYTGCWPIDTVLSSKINEMNTENILYSLDLKIPADLDFKHNVVDICAIIGNILDNAIEECNRIDSPKKEIKISIHYRDDKIIMKVTNPARINNLNISSKLIRSAKRKGRYGFGINSIRERVQKLEGYSDFSWNENEFKVLIIIPVGQSIAQ